MSLSSDQIQQVTDLVGSAQTIIVLIGADATTEEVVTAIAWTKLLQQMGKDARLVSPIERADEAAHLNLKYEITTQLGKRNLVISFDYVPEQVDKVSYHIGEETGRFYLTIKPKNGTPPLDKKSLEIDYAGADGDLIIFIGVDDMADIRPLADEYQDFFRDVPSVALSTGQPQIGTVKVSTSQSAGVAEETASLISQLGWEANDEAATALLYGIEEATDGLRSLSTTPDTFEHVAMLLRAGARRVRRQVKPEKNTGTQQVRGGSGDVGGEENTASGGDDPVESVGGMRLARQPVYFAEALRSSGQKRDGKNQSGQAQIGQIQTDTSGQKAGGYQGRKRQRSAPNQATSRIPLNPDPSLVGGGHLM